MSKGLEVEVSVGDQPSSMEGNSCWELKVQYAGGGYIVEGIQCHMKEFNFHHRSIRVAGGEAAAGNNNSYNNSNDNNNNILIIQ